MNKSLPYHNQKVSTVKVKDLHKYLSDKLKSEFISQDVKRVYCGILEEILCSTQNYKGYNHIAWRNGGYDNWVKDGKPNDTTPYQGNEYDRYYYE